MTIPTTRPGPALPPSLDHLADELDTQLNGEDSPFDLGRVLTPISSFYRLVDNTGDDNGIQ